MVSLWSAPLLLVIGLATGAMGTLLGVGGGFILVPILLFLYPQDSPKTVTSISLLVVFFNALSGTTAYARMRRIDYRTGIVFALSTVPGAVIGVLAISLLSRAMFQFVFGLVLLALAAYLVRVRALTAGLRRLSWGRDARRSITDRDGNAYTYAFSLRLGVAVSFAAGFVSSFFGIGGGIIHVPALIALFGFPAHVAMATSQFILTITVSAGSVTHWATGEFAGGWERPLLLSAGVVIGAQIGARLSSRVRSAYIVGLLSVALGIVGMRLVVGAL